MKIYLAGPCDSQHRSIMMSVAKVLRDLNFEVYCPFELKIENAWDYSQEEWARKVFDADIQALNNCDIMIMISTGRDSTAGTNWEQGYMFANFKPVYVIQINDNPTSLMTFCGCNYFISTYEAHLSVSLKWLVDKIKENKIGEYAKTCYTTLT